VLRAVEIRVATLEERVAARRAASASARESLDDAARLAARATERLPELRAALAAVVADRGAAEADSLAVKERRSSAWDRLQRERERLERLRAACRALEAEGLERARERDAAAAAVTELDASAERVRLEVESLCERIEERYQLPLPGLLDRLEGTGVVRLESDPDVVADLEIGGRILEGVPDLEVRPGALSDFAAIEAQVSELAELRRQLGAVGDVNLAATEEYADVRTRHDQLVAQRADLEESIAGIRAAIAKMNKTCRQRFRDTFDRVDQYFREIYPRLTGGGTGHLALTNEDDLLETGVDVLVQPPGKKLQNLHLLSGGEKAMTAIAVLLSLFRVKPSPFCVLDEVDAPLDEANGTRFNEILREMAGLAQFILITHNRKTMECADTLYGVTMPTPGVSRLVSVRLDA